MREERKVQPPPARRGKGRQGPTHWTLLPTAPGRLRIVPPILTATWFGAPLRFPAPVWEVTATPVPSWLPFDMAVGTVGVEPVDAVASARVGQPLPVCVMVDGDYAPQALRNLFPRGFERQYLRRHR